MELAAEMQNSLIPANDYSNKRINLNAHYHPHHLIGGDYYDYFVVGESGEYSNALLNYPTTKGRSVGLEGGFGLFGSIASDWKTVKIIRR